MKTLEQIIKTRRTVRDFSKQVPSEQDIKDIAASAVYAPYGAGTGIPLIELRKIFIFRQGTQKMKDVENLIIENVKKNYKKISFIVKFLPFLKKKMQPFLKRLQTISEKGIPAFSDAGYFIVLAEKKGFPPVAKASMAHGFENMWLTATEKGLAFRLISATGQMGKNKEFMNLLGLKAGAYAVDGCLIGYGAKADNKEKFFDVDKFTVWVD